MINSRDIQNLTIHHKFLKYLRGAKDLAITSITEKKILEALAVKSDENEEILGIVINGNSSKDEYEYAYNYLDKEFNVFKLCKKDINTRVTPNYAGAKPKQDTATKVKTWSDTIGSVVKTVAVAAGILGISLVIGGKKDGGDSAAK